VCIPAIRTELALGHHPPIQRHTMFNHALLKTPAKL
jgi:hypothetical protein